MVDHHDHDDARAFRWRKAREIRHVGAIIVAAGGDLAHRAGLAGGRVAGRLAFGRRAIGGQHAAHHRRHFGNVFWLEHLLAVASVLIQHHREVFFHAAAGQRQIGACHLYRRNRQSIAVREGHAADGLVQIGRGEQAHRFAGQPAAGVVAEANPLQRVEDGVFGHRKRHLRNAHLARLRQDPRHVDEAAVDGVFDQLGADVEVAGGRVNFRIWRVVLAFQRGQHGKRLDGGAGFVEVGNGAIANAVGAALPPVVGVEGRLIGQRQHFARSCIQHDQRTGLRAVVLYRGLELSIGKKLQPQIQRQIDVLATFRRSQKGEVLHRSAGAVAQHALRARLATQRGVHRQFDALLAHIVDICAANDMRRRLPGGIEAVVRTILVNALDIQIGNPLRDIRRHPAGKKGVAFAASVQALAQHFRRHAEGVAETGEVCLGQGGQLRVHPQSLHRRAHRQRLAVAVENHATVNRNLHFAHRARFALIAQKVALGSGQIAGACRETKAAT